MNLSSGQKLIVVIVLIVLVAAAAFFLLVLPKFSQMATLDQQISDAESEIAQAETLLAQRQQLKQESAQTETQLLALANMMPETPEVPALIIELQDTVNTSGLEFIRISPSPPEPNEAGYSALTAEMVVRGTWPDVVDLLQRLRRITRQVRILSFEASLFENDDASAEQTDTTQVETVILIEVYTMATSETTSTVPPAPATP